MWWSVPHDSGMARITGTTVMLFSIPGFSMAEQFLGFVTSILLILCCIYVLFFNTVEACISH